MIFTHYFNKDTGEIKRFVWLKRNNRQIEYRYNLIMDCYNNLDIYSIRINILKETSFYKSPVIVIKKKKYRRYMKEFEEYEENIL